jgi:hypothetical protein
VWSGCAGTGRAASAELPDEPALTATTPQVTRMTEISRTPTNKALPKLQPLVVKSSLHCRDPPEGAVSHVNGYRHWLDSPLTEKTSVR